MFITFRLWTSYSFEKETLCNWTKIIYALDLIQENMCITLKKKKLLIADF